LLLPVTDFTQMPAARAMALSPITDTARPVRYSRPLRRSAPAVSLPSLPPREVTAAFRYSDLHLLRLLNSLSFRSAMPRVCQLVMAAAILVYRSKCSSFISGGQWQC